jgi:uncharacterized membrane protein
LEDINTPKDNQNNSKDSKTIAKKVVEEIESNHPALLDGVTRKEEIVEAVINQCVEIKSFEYAELHQGPLPSPTTLKGYDDIVPDGAERIMKSFEVQSEHRQKIEKKVVNGQVNQSFIGQVMGFIIALLFLYAGFRLIIKGYEIHGTIISSIDIVGLVSVFVIGRQKKYKIKEKNNN